MHSGTPFCLPIQAAGKRTNACLLSRAASQLCSRGEQTLLKEVEALFPAGELPLTTTGVEAPAFEIDSAAVKKALPRGLPPDVRDYALSTLSHCCWIAIRAWSQP